MVILRISIEVVNSLDELESIIKKLSKFEKDENIKVHVTVR